MTASPDSINDINEQFTLLKVAFDNRLSPDSMTFFPKEIQVNEIRKIQQETNASLSVILRTLIDVGLRQYKSLT